MGPVSPLRELAGVFIDPRIDTDGKTLAEIPRHRIDLEQRLRGHTRMPHAQSKFVGRGEGLTQNLRGASLGKAVGKQHLLDVILRLGVSERETQRARIIRVDMRHPPRIAVQGSLCPEGMGARCFLCRGRIEEKAGAEHPQESVIRRVAS